MVGMLNIYIGEISNSDMVNFNDAWFDSNIDKINFNDMIKNIISTIDRVDYVDKYKVTSKFFEGTLCNISELSTGCKTAINIASFSKKLFNGAECGNNAWQVIFNLKQGNIYIPYFILPRQFNNDIKVHYNGKEEIIHNNKELEVILGRIYGGKA